MPLATHITDNTNVPINPYVSDAPAATATFAVATSLQGSVYNLFGIDTNEYSNNNALPTFPPCEDDDYEGNNDDNEDANEASNNQEQLPRAPSTNAHVNTIHRIFGYDTGNEIFPIDVLDQARGITRACILAIACIPRPFQIFAIFCIVFWKINSSISSKQPVEANL